MFILGTIGILQVLLLPGLIVRKFFDLPKGFWLRMAAIMGISLITNYLFVFISTLLGIFTQVTAIILLILEIGALIYLYRKEILATSISDFIVTFWHGLIAPIYKIFPKLNN